MTSPLDQKIRITSPVVITANRLADGAVVFRRADGSLHIGPELGRDAVLLVNLSGRGDKDVDIAARYFGHVTGPAG